jgi:hypothetical protein
MAPALIRCPQCGALVADVDGPVHAYVPGAPGCWAAFGELQASELQRFGGHPAHDLVVDAYMAQHPGDGSDRRDRQSVFVHLIGLCAVLERGWPTGRRLLSQRTGERTEYPRLVRDGPGELSVTDLVGAADADQYGARARAWAESVWRSWEPEQERIRTALDGLLVS